MNEFNINRDISLYDNNDKVPIIMNDYYKSFKQIVQKNGLVYECHTV